MHALARGLRVPVRTGRLRRERRIEDCNDDDTHPGGERDGHEHDGHDGAGFDCYCAADNNDVAAEHTPNRRGIAYVLAEAQRQAIDVSRDFQDAATAYNCDLCDPYTIYTWLVQNRGYPSLTKSEFDLRTLEVCSMPADQRNRDRVNIALFLLDAGSDKKRVCPSAFD